MGNLLRQGYTGDFLKSSTKYGGYSRDNFVDLSKNIQLTEEKIAHVAAALKQPYTFWTTVFV